jgi:hypothetical protein
MAKMAVPQELFRAILEGIDGCDSPSGIWMKEK